MASAIADASVLIHLSRLDRLALLEAFYDLVVVPESVWVEVVEQGASRPGSKALRTARETEWVEVQTAEREDLFRLLRQSLGPGESEAITLAVEHPDHDLLLDEADGRRRAKVYDLSLTGTVGLLIRAHAQGRIKDLEQVLVELRDEAGFWIGDDLIEEVLETVETDTAAGPERERGLD